MTNEQEEYWRPVVGFSGYEVSDLGRVRSMRSSNRIVPRAAPKLMSLKPSSSNRYVAVSLYVDVNGSLRQVRRSVHRLVLEAFVGPCPAGMQCRHFPDPRRENNRLCNLRWGTPQENADDRGVHGTNASGDRHGSKTHPERVPRGDRHGSRTSPESRARGDRHGSKTKPDSAPRGDRSWSRTHPDRLARGDKHGSRTKPHRVRRGSSHGCSKLVESDIVRIRELLVAGEKIADIGALYGVDETSISMIKLGRTWGHVPCTEAALLLRSEPPRHGSRHSQAKFTEEQMLRALQELNARRGQRGAMAQVSRLLGMSEFVIQHLNAGSSWRHLPRPWDSAEKP